ncbi:MAG: CotH kinase family protein [Flavobacteriales bacterium]|nr:MAG: CotH kinase family protein [Flavobacteriales bacterium]
MKGNWQGPVVLALAAFGSLAWAVRVTPDHSCIPPPYDHGEPEKLVLVRTASRWLHPIGDQPVLEHQRGDGNRWVRSLPTELHGSLPIVSLVVDPNDLFGDESGIYTVGNAFLHDQDQVTLKYLREPRWWKYPGNYLFRGKEWERDANIEIYAPGGMLKCNDPVGVRINGNTTRGFPQKALRISFKDDKPIHLFGSEARRYDEIVLRASGNDQDRTMFRDALQHRLCEGMAFDVSRAQQSVVYINGAYWGIHNIRERIEDDELAIRHGLKKKHIVILADRALPYRNDDDGVEAKRFRSWLKRMERMTATAEALPDSIEAIIDVESFLQYMSAQIVFGNTDWPDQNVKYWRWTDEQDTTNTKTDGRWRFIMGDSDLSFGYEEIAPDKYLNMFDHLRRKQGPVARLFKMCIAVPELKQRFDAVLRNQLAGPLSSERMEAAVLGMSNRIDAEMHRHVRRWRRPADHGAWQAHVDAMVNFAHDRPRQVLAWWEAERAVE